MTLTLAGVGGVFESARWAGPIETWRLAVLAAALVPLTATGRVSLAVGAAGVALCVTSLMWFLPLRRHLVRDELAPIM